MSTLATRVLRRLEQRAQRQPPAAPLRCRRCRLPFASIEELAAHEAWHVRGQWTRLVRKRGECE